MRAGCKASDFPLAEFTMRIAMLSLLVLLSAPAMAQIYKYTDERGNTVYTNQPRMA